MRTLTTFAAAAALLVVPATAGATSKAITITPASPRALETIHVTFKPAANAPAGDEARYRVAVSVPQNGACNALADVGLRPKPGRARWTATIRANRGSHPGWCAGSAVARVYRSDDAVAGDTTPVARRRFTIRPSAGFRPGAFGTDVLVQVLPGSTATVSVPGRADRVLGLGGTIDGFIPGTFVLNSDYRVRLGTNLREQSRLAPAGGSLVVRSLTTDALCAPGTIRTDGQVADGDGSSLVFRRDGTASGALVLDTAPETFAGCAGPATGATTLSLSGTLGVTQLADVPLTATLGGVPAGGDATATVTIALHLKVTILDL